MEEFTELELKVINRLGDMVQKNELSNNCLVKIIEQLGGFLNLKTISDYSKSNCISYNGVKNYRKKVILFNVKFIIDNE
jgi:hypothetical protein